MVVVVGSWECRVWWCWELGFERVDEVWERSHLQMLQLAGEVGWWSYAVIQCGHWTRHVPFAGEDLEDQTNIIATWNRFNCSNLSHANKQLIVSNPLVATISLRATFNNSIGQCRSVPALFRQQSRIRVSWGELCLVVLTFPCFFST